MAAGCWCCRRRRHQLGSSLNTTWAPLHFKPARIRSSTRRSRQVCARVHASTLSGAADMCKRVRTACNRRSICERINRQTYCSWPGGSFAPSPKTAYGARARDNGLTTATAPATTTTTKTHRRVRPLRDSHSPAAAAGWGDLGGRIAHPMCWYTMHVLCSAGISLSHRSTRRERRQNPGPARLGGGCRAMRIPLPWPIRCSSTRPLRSTSTLRGRRELRVAHNIKRIFQVAEWVGGGGWTGVRVVSLR